MGVLPCIDTCVFNLRSCFTTTASISGIRVPSEQLLRGCLGRWCYDLLVRQYLLQQMYVSYLVA